jgi:hypothetical protein
MTTTHPRYHIGDLVSAGDFAGRVMGVIPRDPYAEQATLDFFTIYVVRNGRGVFELFKEEDLELLAATQY